MSGGFRSMGITIFRNRRNRGVGILHKEHNGNPKGRNGFYPQILGTLDPHRFVFESARIGCVICGRFYPVTRAKRRGRTFKRPTIGRRAVVRNNPGRVGDPYRRDSVAISIFQRLEGFFLHRVLDFGATFLVDLERDLDLPTERAAGTVEVVTQIQDDP